MVFRRRLIQRCHPEAVHSAFSTSRMNSRDEGPAVAVCPFGVRWLDTALLSRGALFALRMLLRSSTRRRRFCIFPLRCHPERVRLILADDEGPTLASPPLPLAGKNLSAAGARKRRGPALVQRLAEAGSSGEERAKRAIVFGVGFKLSSRSASQRGTCFGLVFPLLLHRSFGFDFHGWFWWEICCGEIFPSWIFEFDQADFLLAAVSLDFFFARDGQKRPGRTLSNLTGKTGT
jgi:hypothetical protein